MKPSIKFKTTNLPLLIAFALVWLALLPKGQAVSPAPDGGYPGGNTAEGQAALLSLTTGGFNTAVGFLSLRSDTTGGFNTALGAGALLANTADSNTATGVGALLSNVSGGVNTANGAFALFSNIDGSHDTAVGYKALFSNTTAGLNTAIGSLALANCTGSLQTAIGAGAGLDVTTATNVICIGAGVSGANVTNSCFIGNIVGVQTQLSNAIPVLIDSDGQLGTQNSSRRFKEEIKPMDRLSEAILALNPVTFQYKSDNTDTSQFGLIAEEVEKVNPDLVVRDKNGEIYTVRYEAVNAMLLNEFLKEHKTVQELKKEIAALAATVKEQAAQIQKVSAQIETSGPAPRVVVGGR